MSNTNADIPAASAVPQTPHTLVLTDNEGGLMTMSIECTATPDAPCRRRPPDWMDRETWTDEEATETGHECWAVEWADMDPESIIWSGSPIRIPVDVVYDEGVEVIPVADQPSAEPTEAEVRVGAEAAYEVARIREHFPTEFDRAPLGIQNTYLAMARAALVAAREALEVSGR